MVNTRFPGVDWPVGGQPASLDRVAFDTAADALFDDPETHGRTLALVVVHHGEIVCERYDPEFSAASTFISWSVAKSLTHALVGMAVGDGRLSLDAAGLFPEWESDERRTITLRHLLGMKSGLEWTEDYVDGTVSDVIEMLFSGHHPDHARYAISKSLSHTPGTRYCYSSGTTNIVTRVLSRALGDVPPSRTAMSAHIQRLFDAIGMTSATAKFDASGNFVGSSFVYATARDFARFGFLYLNDGKWNGKRILPEGWVEYARTWGAADEENGFGYGAHWWLHPDVPGSMTGLGYQGQFLWVVPDRDLVVVRLGVTDAPFNENVRRRLVGIIGAFPAENVPTDKSGDHV